MKSTTRIVTAIALVFLSTGAHAQDSAAAERARIANERIAAEAERRARAEADDRTAAARSQTAAALDEASEATAAPTSPTPARTAPVPEQTAPKATPAPPDQSTPVEPAATDNRTRSSGTDFAPLLEQLKTLGELKDAGYVTEDEFERIKSRLLDGGLR